MKTKDDTAISRGQENQQACRLFWRAADPVVAPLCDIIPKALPHSTPPLAGCQVTWWSTLIKAQSDGVARELGDSNTQERHPESAVKVSKGVAMPTSPEPENTTPHEFAVPADENNDAKIRNQCQSLHHGIDAPGY
jgi:hypothetical protein